MMTALIKKEIKSNLKIYIIFLSVIAIYIFSLLAMYNPALEESLIALEKSMPEVLAIFGMQNRGTTLLDFIVNYLYRFVLIVTPFIYTTIMCYKLVSRYEEKGGMAYLLNSHYSRKQVIVTQGINLLLGISVMIVFVTALTILSCAFMFQGELDITGFLTLNLGLLILQIFLATFCFMFTCAFSEIKYSVGIGAGIGSLFIMIQMVSQVFDNELLKYCNPLSLFNPDQIIEYNPISLLCIGILFVVSILFFNVAVKSFKRKDLML